MNGIPLNTRHVIMRRYADSISSGWVVRHPNGAKHRFSYAYAAIDHAEALAGFDVRAVVWSMASGKARKYCGRFLGMQEVASPDLGPDYEAVS